MNREFNQQILEEKLAKLNSSQQCIETLSHWCIFHRNKAEQVVATWDKQFHCSEMVQKVPLLYLANDILQNSKRKGNEFVTEFWKVLPSALKEVVEKGDDRGKNVVSRLVAIWEERRVFGSRAQSLKDVMLEGEHPAPLEFGRKRSRSVKIVKRDSRSIKTKLTVGGTAEKIVTAFDLVFSEHGSEDEEMSKCKSAVNRVKHMEDDVEVALSKAKDPKRKTLAKELEEEECILRQSIEKLKVVEANRLALVSQLREALHEQESELESVRTQMQVAQEQAEEAGKMRKHLDDENYVAKMKTGQTTKKSTAAMLADMLAASSSSQYIMTSVLSTFAAEEAKNAGVTKSSAASTTFSTQPSNAANSSTPKPEQTLLDSNVLMPANQHNHSQNNLYQIPPPTMQGHISNSQVHYHSLPNPPPQQYLQPSGGIASSYAYDVYDGYGSLPPLPPGPPPPAPPSYMVSPMVPLTQSLQMGHQQPLAMGNQLQPTSLPLPPPAPSFRPLTTMQPPGMVYYTRHHQSQ